MMGAVFKVETRDLRRSATLIEEKTARYDAEWAKIYTEIANLRVDWQGQSSDEFNKQIEGYRNDFQELSKILTSYKEFLVSTADRIEKAEEQMKQSASQLNSGN